MDRTRVWTVGGIVILNLAFFIGAAPIFLEQIHHHWALPAGALIVALQWLAWEFLWAPRTLSLGRTTLLSVLFFYCLLGLARVETIFKCYQFCSFKLGLMHLIAGTVFLAASFRYPRTSRLRVVASSLGALFLAGGAGIQVWHFYVAGRLGMP